MPRTARKLSESQYYHVVIRGIGRQLIFEEDEDNERFLSTLQRYRRELGFELVAYCLMENHAHLLIRDVKEQLPDIIKKIGVSYVHYFNNKYDRTGHLFQDRYRSEAVETDEYLLCVIRYIHRNPEKAGVAKASEYRWSSYGAYVKPNNLVDNAAVLEILADRGGFDRLMRESTDDNCLEAEPRRGMRDPEAKVLIRSLFGLESCTQLQQLGKRERDEVLGELRRRGLTIHQLERLTGIHRGVIQRG